MFVYQRVTSNVVKTKNKPSPSHHHFYGYKPSKMGWFVFLFYPQENFSIFLVILPDYDKP